MFSQSQGETHSLMHAFLSEIIGTTLQVCGFIVPSSSAGMPVVHMTMLAENTWVLSSFLGLLSQLIRKSPQILRESTYPGPSLFYCKILALTRPLHAASYPWNLSGENSYIQNRNHGHPVWFESDRLLSTLQLKLSWSRAPPRLKLMRFLLHSSSDAAGHHTCHWLAPAPRTGTPLERGLWMFHWLSLLSCQHLLIPFGMSLQGLDLVNRSNHWGSCTLGKRLSGRAQSPDLWFHKGKGIIGQWFPANCY